MTKRTKTRIRKVLMFARGLCLVLSVPLLLIAAMAVGNGYFGAAFIVAASAVLCFVLSLFCDYLLGGYKSPFYY